MKRGRTILRLLAGLLTLLAIVLVIGWLLGKNALAHSLVEKAIAKQTTCEYNIGSVTLSPGARVLTLRNVVLDDPNVPGDTPMLIIDTLIATVRPDSVFSPPLQLQGLDIDVREFHIRRAPDSTCNLDALYPGASALLPPPPSAPLPLPTPPWLLPRTFRPLPLPPPAKRPPRCPSTPFASPSPSSPSTIARAA